MNAKSLATKVRQLSLAISLALASLTIVSITTTQSAHADTCSCDQGKLYSIEIDELNNAHPHKLTLAANNAYYQLIDDKGAVVQDKLYDIKAYEDGRIVAKRHGYFGAIDATGKMVLDFKYGAIEVLDNNFYHLTKYFGSKEATAIANSAGDWLYPASKVFDQNIQTNYLYADKTNNVTYFMISKDGKYGLINDKKQTLITPVYDQLELLDTCPNERLFMKAKLGDKVGLIDQYQKVVVPFTKNIDIENFNEDKQIFSVKSYVPKGAGNIGHLNRETVISESLINGKGVPLIKSDASIRLLNSHLYEYKKSGQYGIINNSGAIVLPASFDYLYSQYSQYNAPILAAHNQKIGIVTKGADSKLKVSEFYDGLELSEDSTYTLHEIESQLLKNEEDASTEEEVIYEATSAEEATEEADNTLGATLYNPSNSSYIAQINHKFGLVDSNNKVLIPIIYDELSYFNRFIKVKKDNKYGLLTDNNETVKALIYDDITPLSDSHGTEDNIGIVFTKGNQQQLTNEFGSIITPFSDYRFVDNKLDYLDNMSVIEKDGKYGLFSVKEKKVLIQPIYEDMYERIYNDSILAQLNGKKVLIDTSGKVLISDLSQYAAIERSNNENNIIVKTNDDKYGVIDYKGKTIIPAVYDSLELQGLSNNYEAVWGENKAPLLLYIVGKNGKHGIFAHNGSVVAPIAYDYIQSLIYPAYLAVVKDKSADSETVGEANNLGLMNLSGKVVLDMKYHDVRTNLYDPEGRLYAINSHKNIVETYDKKLTFIKTQSLQAFIDTNEWYKE